MMDLFGLEVARKFSRADEAEWPAYFESLRRTRKLAEAVRQMNAMLDEPHERPLAEAALRRIGLWHEVRLDEARNLADPRAD